MRRFQRLVETRPTAASLLVAAALMSLTFGIAGAKPESGRGAVAIQLTKTVGTDPATCAAGADLTVLAGTMVVYCYEVENTGAQTVTVHDLLDNQLGTLLSGHSLTLGPGSTFAVTRTAQIQETTVNDATWTATGPGGSDADNAMATVTVAEPAVELVKTVGKIPNVCAATNAITVGPNGEVTYCYQARNTGNVALGRHDLVDDQLGTLLDDHLHGLDPGQTLEVKSTVAIAATTVNSATWRARDPFAAQASSATATVTVSALIFADGFESGDTTAW